MTDESLTDLRRRIEKLVENGAVEELQETLTKLHPSDIADLFPRLGRLEQNFVWDLIPDEVSHDVLVELDDPAQEQLLDHLTEGEIGQLVEELDSDDAADVIGVLDDDKARKVLDTMDHESRQEVRQLLTFDEETAGGIMALEVASVKESDTVRDAVNHLRDLVENEGIEDIYNVYIIAEDGRLCGALNLRQFILAPPETPVSELMDTDLTTVTTAMDQEEVANLFRKYDLVSVPVVDDSGRLVGRITVDDIVDVLTEEAEEDLSIIAGTRAEEPSDQSIFKVYWHRFPWLFTGLMGGIVSANVLHHFEASLTQMIALAFFVPVITAMGGNTAIQSASIVVRGLATGEIELRDLLPRIIREIKITFLSGLTLSLILSTIVALWLQETRLGVLIGSILIINMCIAATFGTTVPILMKRLGIDPALAMGPFVTTAVDIIGLLIYLGFAVSFL